MALNKLRKSTVIKDSEGDEYVFVYGVNTRREIARRTKRDVQSVFDDAFAIKRIKEKQDDGTDVEKSVADERPWDLDALCTIVSCCSEEPKLTEDQVGVLIDDIGVLPLLEIFGGKAGAENPTTPSA